MRYCFITGLARTGTSALCDLLSSSEQALILNERYAKIRDEVSVDHFKKDALSEEIKDKDWTKIQVIGDKGTYYKVLDHLEQEFSDFKLIYCYRNPICAASSFAVKAIASKRWEVKIEGITNVINNSIQAVLDWGQSGRVIVVEYEKLWCGDQEYYKGICKWLGIQPNISKFMLLSDKWDDRQQHRLVINQKQACYLWDNVNTTLLRKLKDIQ